MRIYLLCDLEGVTGLTRRPQAWFWEKGATDEDRAEGRRLMTDEVNAAVETALRAGADRIVVCDAHHGGGNLIDDQLIRDSRLRHETRNAAALAPSLDETFGALMLLGYHAKAGTAGAFLPHTWSGNWLDLRINGASCGEIGIDACSAGHWGVPVVLVQGDDAACAEARALLPDMVTAPVKRVLSFDHAQAMTPPATPAWIAARIREAIEKARAKAIRPFKPRLPMTVQITMNTPEAALRAAGKPGVRAVDDLTVEADVARQCDVLRPFTPKTRPPNALEKSGEI